MTTGPVQELVDALAERLQRSVTVEDHTLQLVAFSRHYGDADPARIWSLLNRRSRPDDVDYAMLRTAHGATRLDANADIELYARVCVPLRAQGMLLGFLWLIDRDHTLRPDEITDTEKTAALVARALHQRLILREDETTLSAHLLGRLISTDPATRSGAITDLLSGGFIGNDGYVGVVSVGTEDEPADATVIGRVIKDATHHLPPGTWIARSSGRAGTVLLARGTTLGPALTWLARALAAKFDDHLGVRIGVSGVGQSLADAVTVARQAEIALTLAGSDAGLGPVGYWDELGPYQLIGQLPPGLVGNDLLPRGIFHLLRARNTQELTSTAEAFLDCGGDKQEAARRLGIHRSTLYYRLDRISAITGLDLGDGQARLLLHLAVKLQHLVPHGEYPAQG